MSEFTELVKKFDKVRDYMRDFYVYGFKTRGDFTKKSARTYDNEKRRIESYMGDYMKWEYTSGSKSSFISVDCAQIPINPLYAVWKSKSFTDNDIMLHFYIIDVLSSTTTALGISELTDRICKQSEMIVEVQTVRNKCREYTKLGMLIQSKRGKAYEYSLAPQEFLLSDDLKDAIAFFQGANPFGQVGSYIMDKEKVINQLFSFKHHYIAHTLEDGVLLDILIAIRQNREIEFESQSSKTGQSQMMIGIPMKIFVSAATGRRFVCMYCKRTRRFNNYRLDYIKKVNQHDSSIKASQIRQKLDQNLDRVWGVSFGGANRSEQLRIKLYINEKSEKYIIDRIHREGQGGSLERISDNTFVYSKELFDSNDISPWIKTFVGRTIDLEGSNESVINRYYNDIRRMAAIYELDMDEMGGEE